MTDSIGIVPHEKTPLVRRTRPRETINNNSPTPIASALAIPVSLSEERDNTCVYGSDRDSDSNSDDYIVSLIQRTSTFHHEGFNDGDSGNEIHENEAAVNESKRGHGIVTCTTLSSPSSLSSLQGTTWGQTVVHPVKGYIGCGILSLPWAISQLGIATSSYYY